MVRPNLSEQFLHLQNGGADDWLQRAGVREHTQWKTQPLEMLVPPPPQAAAGTERNVFDSKIFADHLIWARCWGPRGEPK